MKTAVVGCGYWGRHLIRNFYNSRLWDLKYICDFKKENLDKYTEMYHEVIPTESLDTILEDKEIDAVVIATPVLDHYESAKKSLLAGKHVWLEKPLTTNSRQAEDLCKTAEAAGLILHVDHTFIYTPAVEKIKELVSKGELGNMLYFDSVRINLGLFRHDVNVLWDLAPHDVSILEYTLDKKPVSVTAVGASPYKYSENDLESIAYMTVKFDDDTIAHFHSNWLSPVKIRQIIIGGDKKMLVFNDMESSEKIKIYDSGVEIETDDDIYNALVSYRTGDSYSPTLDNYEALAFECEHFHECIKAGKDTRTPGRSGLYVVKILEAANESLKTGKPAIIR